MKIILGTAHLSSTAGKRSPDGLFREYKYSREICKLVKEALVQRGYDCVIDYEDDDRSGTTTLLDIVQPGDIFYTPNGSSYIFGNTGHVAIIEGV